MTDVANAMVIASRLRKVYHSGSEVEALPNSKTRRTAPRAAGRP